MAQLPKVEQVASRLREQIASGALAAGDELPSEADLMDAFGVARGTIRLALTRLRGEGLVRAEVGRGWFVQLSRPVLWHLQRPEDNERTDVSPSDAWSEDVREQGRTPTEERQTVVLVPEPRIAALLELGDDDEVVIRRRLRYVDDELCAVADTIFPRDLVKDSEIAGARDVLPGTLAVLERLGYPVDPRHNRDSIVSRPATAAEAETFGKGSGDSMLEVTRTRFTAQGRPVAVTMVTAPGDKVIIIL